MAIDVSKFILLKTFAEKLQHIVEDIRNLPRLEGAQPMMVAGDPEKISETERRISGIPVDEIKFGEFLELSQDFETALVSEKPR